MPNQRSPEKRTFSVILPRSLIAQLEEISVVEKRSRNLQIELFLQRACEAWFEANAKPEPTSAREEELKALYARLTKGKGTWPPDAHKLKILQALPFNPYPLEEGVKPEYSEEEIAHQKRLIAKLLPKDHHPHPAASLLGSSQ